LGGREEAETAKRRNGGWNQDEKDRPTRSVPINGIVTVSAAHPDGRLSWTIVKPASPSKKS
jgi:hypothetical protein